MKRALYFFAAVFFLFTAGNVFAQATVTTDQSDYPPGSTAIITGSGFQPGEVVQLQVTNITNPFDDGEEHDAWSVTADADGNFTTTWYVTEDEVNTTLELTAVGLTSGLTAQEIFTDASYNISSISIGSQNGTLTNGASSSASYTITNFFSGNGQSVGAVTNRVTIGLPTGATASFSLVPTTGPGNGGSSGNPGAFTNKLTITSATTTPAGTYTITMVGDDNKGGHATNTTTFTIIAAKASKLAFTIQPANTTAAMTMANVVVQLQDANGNNISSNNVPITLTLNTGSFAAGSTTTVNSDSTGQSTFSNLKINTAGSYTITAAASGIGTGLSNATSSSFTVKPSAATTLVVTGYPSPRTAGQPATLTVTAQDPFANVATNYTGTVHLTSSDGQASLAANHKFIASDAGTFQFTGNIFHTAGTQSLTATDVNSNTLTGTQSGIIINSGTVTKLIFSTQPAGAVYKTAFTTQPIVRTVDAFGNLSTNGLTASLTLSLALTTGSGSLVGATNIDIGTTHSTGVATFSGLQINKAENGDVLTANATGFTSTNSSAFNVGTAILTVTATGMNKIYDGATNATITLSDNKFSGDTITDNYTAANFANKNVGTNKTVTVTGISITGASAANYSLASTTATTTANITSASLTVTANNTNRVFGAANPAFTASYSGFASGDNPGVLSGTSTFGTIANTTSNVGIYTITVTNGTLSATNYSFTFVNGQLTITQASTTNVVSVAANPSPTGSNVTLTATLSAIAPGAGTPTGTIQFLADGSAIGSPALLTSGVANLTIASLAHGSHLISAQYAGDGNFFGSTNNLSQSLLINLSPTAGTFTLTTTENISATIAAAKLAGVGKDADHDALSVTAVNSSSAHSGTVSLASGTITYLPPTNYIGADSFTYTLADSFGATTNGTVNVTVNAPGSGQTPNITSFTMQQDGSAKIKFSGIPGKNYLIQATTNIAPPNWITIATNTAATNGIIIFIDTNALNFPSRYYRTAKP